MSDLVNCILQCAGCDLEVTSDDIRDPENIPNRLIDLQSVYQEVRAHFFSQLDWMTLTPRSNKSQTIP